MPADNQSKKDVAPFPGAPKMPLAPTADAELGPLYSRHDLQAYGRACYLAGLEAARGCVPAEIHERGAAERHYNSAIRTMIANLEALKEGVTDAQPRNVVTGRE